GLPGFGPGRGAAAVFLEPVAPLGGGQVVEDRVDDDDAGGAGPLALEAFFDELLGATGPFARGEAAAEGGEVPDARVVRTRQLQAVEDAERLLEATLLEKLHSMRQRPGVVTSATGVVAGARAGGRRRLRGLGTHRELVAVTPERCVEVEDRVVDPLEVLV